jgi:hypothetical protein
VCEHTFVRVYNFTVTEYRADQPWVVIGSGRHRVELEDGQNFFAWADERWPKHRFKITVDPGDLTR